MPVCGCKGKARERADGQRLDDSGGGSSSLPFPSHTIDSGQQGNSNSSCIGTHPVGRNEGVRRGQTQLSWGGRTSTSVAGWGGVCVGGWMGGCSKSSFLVYDCGVPDPPP